MPALIIAEQWNSGGGTADAQSDTREIIFIVAHAASPDEALLAAAEVAPLSMVCVSGRTVVKLTMSFQVMEGDLVEVTVHYGPRKPVDPGGYDFSFDTTGGTAKITQSRRTVSSYTPNSDDKPAPDCQGGINVTDSGVEGVEHQVGVFKWTETHLIPIEAATFAYALVLKRLTGKRSSGPFRVFGPQEVIFRGAQGGKKDENYATVTFSFEADEALEDETLPAGASEDDDNAFVHVNKKPWDYLWFRYKDIEDAAAKTVVKRPVAAYVEELVLDGDFSLLGIGE